MSAPPTTTPWVPVWPGAGAGGGGADLTYEGDFAAATTYQDGDIVVKDGIAYLCVGGPTTEAPSPTPWGAARPTKESELAYAEKTSDTSITATTQAGGITVVTTPPLTFDGQTTILIEFFSRGVQVPSGSGAWEAITLWEDSAVLDDIAFIQNMGVAGAGITVPVRLARRLTPAAGTRSYSIRAYGSATGGLVRGTAGTPAFIRIKLPSSPIPIIPGASLPVSYGTTLPVNPVDGQEHILVDSLTAPTYQWRLRYNASSTHADKWEFVGGAPATALATGSVNTASASYVDLAGGPSLAVPYAGVYEIEFGTGYFWSSVAAQSAMMAPTAAGLAVSDTYAIVNNNSAPAPGSRKVVERVTAAGTVKVQYRAAGGATGSYVSRWLAVRPVRIGG